MGLDQSGISQSQNDPAFMKLSVFHIFFKDKINSVYHQRQKRIGASLSYSSYHYQLKKSEYR